MRKEEREEMNRAMQQEREAHQKKLDALEAKAKPMENVVLDGGNGIAYFVAKHRVEMEETVVSIPFHKLLTLLGQMMLTVLAPMFQGVRPASSGGGEPRMPGKPDLNITS